MWYFPRPMQPDDAPTLLQTCLAIARGADDAEQAWAFLVFCGLLETSAHDEFIALFGAQPDVSTLAESLLDSATQRAELLDARRSLSARLWQYFQVGSSLVPEQELGFDSDAGTQPGISSVES